MTRPTIILAALSLPLTLVHGQIGSDGTLRTTPRGNGVFVALKDRIVLWGGTSTYAANRAVTQSPEIGTTVTEFFYANFTLRNTVVQTVPSGEGNYLDVHSARCDVLNDKIYCFGGQSNSGSRTIWGNLTTWEAGTFQTHSVNGAKARNMPGLAIMDQRAYVYGGYDREADAPGLSNSDSTQVTDPANRRLGFDSIVLSVNSTSSLPVPPTRESESKPPYRPDRSPCFTRFSPTQILLDEGPTDHDVWTFDTSSSSWQALYGPQDLRHGHTPKKQAACAAGRDGRVWSFGGFHSLQYGAFGTNQIAVLDLVDRKRGFYDAGGSDGPTKRFGSHMVMVGKYLVVFGGFDKEAGGKWVAEDGKFYFFDTEGQKWVSAATVAADQTFKTSSIGVSETTIGIGSVDPEQTPKIRIIGAVVGVIVVVHVIGICLCVRRRRNARAKAWSSERVDATAPHAQPPAYELAALKSGPTPPDASARV
ncbi:hypothetical protein HK097_005418 [Rhizophlyctis rosea]|uniref:Kelch repeat protein n=1 Tax=Rhizophlyctis rosea TaxID=64517 RepID=A0AAD5SGT2_9FUNG|nr:hypothetical protein HK097_005418 [Rhizophlyctis rosea]